MTTHARQQPVYRPMTLVDLAGHLTAADDDGHRWRLIAAFLEEHRHEPAAERAALLADEPPSTTDDRWDVFLAAWPNTSPPATAEEPPPGPRTAG